MPKCKRNADKKGYQVVYYDIDLEDINPSVGSVEKVIDIVSPRAVVIVSMYGNSADLEKFQI